MNYELTTADKLQPGDRFYKAGDKKQEVKVMIDHPVSRTNYQTYRFWYLDRAIYDNGGKEEIKMRFAKAIKAGTEEIRLTHKLKRKINEKQN